MGASERVKCFTSNKQQSNALDALTSVGYFPEGKKEQRAAIASAEALGKGCSTTGKKLASSMSTVQVARDMELMRRAVGDKKLTYIASPTARSSARSTPTCTQTACEPSRSTVS